MATGENVIICENLQGMSKRKRRGTLSNTQNSSIISNVYALHGDACNLANIFSKRVCIARALWLMSSWKSIYAMKPMQRNDIDTILQSFDATMNPMVDEEVAYITRLWRKKCFVWSSSLRRHDSSMLFCELEHHLSENFLLEAESTSDPAQSSKAPKRLPIENVISRNNAQIELAMLWSVLGVLLMTSTDRTSPVTAFFQDLMNDIMQYTPMSLSALWKYIEYPHCTESKVGDSVYVNNSIGEIVDDQFESLISSIVLKQNIGIFTTTISKYHDPIGVIQNLFNLAENNLVNALFYEDLSGSIFSLLENVETSVSACLLLATKSARLSLLLRALTLAFVSLYSKSNSNDDTLDIQLSISLFETIMKDMNVPFPIDEATENQPSNSVKSSARDNLNLQCLESALKHRISKGGILLTFGKAEHGKLGHGDCQQHRVLPTTVDALENSSIIKVASMSTYTLALDEAGSIYIWGTGGSVGSLSGSRRDMVPRLLEAFPYPKSRVVDISCGLGHTLFLSDSGSVFAWGNGANGRLGLGDVSDHTEACWIASLGDEIITSIQCGASHSMALTSTGSVYCWGKNSQGQCGVGHNDDVIRPRLVRSLPFNYHTIVQLAAGWEHSLALSSSGKLFSWGCGYKDNRRVVVPPVLGLGHSDSRSSPTEIISLDGVFVQHVCSGWDHCLALDNKGKVLSWGSGQNGKLGHGTDENFSVPCIISALEKMKISFISAGCEHSAAISQDGAIYTWGHGEGGRLGHGDGVTYMIPTKVSYIESINLTPFFIHCGDKFTAVLANKQQITLLQSLNGKEWLLGSSLDRNLSTDSRLSEFVPSASDLSESVPIRVVACSILSKIDHWTRVPVRGEKQHLVTDLPCDFDHPFCKECNPSVISMLFALFDFFSVMFLERFDSLPIDGNEIRIGNDFDEAYDTLSMVVNIMNVNLENFADYFYRHRTKEKTLKTAEKSQKRRHSVLHDPSKQQSPTYDEEDVDMDEEDDDITSRDDLKRSMFDGSVGENDNEFSVNDDRSTHFASHDGSYCTPREMTATEEFKASPPIAAEDCRDSRTLRSPYDEDHRVSPAPSYTSLDQSVASDELVSTFGLLSQRSMNEKSRKIYQDAMNIDIPHLDDDSASGRIIHEDFAINDPLLTSTSGYRLYRFYRNSLESSSLRSKEVWQSIKILAENCFTFLNRNDENSQTSVYVGNLWRKLQMSMVHFVHVFYSFDDCVKLLIDVTINTIGRLSILPGVLEGLLRSVGGIDSYIAASCDHSMSFYVKAAAATSQALQIRVGMKQILSFLSFASSFVVSKYNSVVKLSIHQSLMSLCKLWVSIPVNGALRAFYESRMDTRTFTSPSTLPLAVMDINELLSVICDVVKSDIDRLINSSTSDSATLSQSVASTVLSSLAFIPSDRRSFHSKNSIEKTQESSYIVSYDFDQLFFGKAMTLINIFTNAASKVSKPVVDTLFEPFRHVFRYIADVSLDLLDNSYEVSSVYLIHLLRETNANLDINFIPRRIKSIDNSMILLFQKIFHQSLNSNSQESRVEDLWPHRQSLKTGSTSKSSDLVISVFSLVLNKSSDSSKVDRSEQLSFKSIFNSVRVVILQNLLFAMALTIDESKEYIYETDDRLLMEIWLLSVTMTAIIAELCSKTISSFNHSIELFLDELSANLLNLVLNSNGDISIDSRVVENLAGLYGKVCVDGAISAGESNESFTSNVAECFYRVYDYCMEDLNLSLPRALRTPWPSQSPLKSTPLDGNNSNKTERNCDHGSIAAFITSIVSASTETRRLRQLTSQSIVDVVIELLNGTSSFDSDTALRYFCQCLDPIRRDVSNPPDRSALVNLIPADQLASRKTLPCTVSLSRCTIRALNATRRIPLSDPKVVESGFITGQMRSRASSVSSLTLCLQIYSHWHSVQSHHEYAISNTTRENIKWIVSAVLQMFLDYLQKSHLPVDNCELLETVKLAMEVLIRFEEYYFIESTFETLISIMMKLQDRADTLWGQYQGFFDVLSTFSGQQLITKTFPIDTSNPMVFSDISTPTGEYTLGFWLFISNDWINRIRSKKTSERPVSEEKNAADEIYRVHIISRVPETGDFSYPMLFEHKFPTHCDPSVFLCVDDDKVFLSVYVTLPSMTKTSGASLTKQLKRIHLQSTNLSSNQWIEVAITLTQDKLTPDTTVNEQISISEFMIRSDSKPQTNRTKFCDILTAKLFINGALNQVMETQSAEGRHPFHQNVVLGDVPRGHALPDSSATSLLISDLFWIPHKDALINHRNQIESTPSRCIEKFCENQDVLTMMNVVLVRTVNPLSSFKLTPSSFLKIENIAFRAIIAGHKQLQITGFKTLEHCYSSIDHLENRDSLIISAQETLRRLVILLDSLFIDSDHHQDISQRIVKGKKNSFDTSVESAVSCWAHRCIKSRNVGKVFKNELETYSNCPMFTCDENSFIRGVSTLVCSLETNNCLRWRQLLEYFANQGVNQKTLSLLSDIRSGGWLPFVQFGDQVIVHSNEFPLHYDSTDLEKNGSGVEENVAFRSVASVYQFNELKSGVWLSECDGFYSNRLKRLALPTDSRFLFASEMLPIIDYHKAILDDHGIRSSTILDSGKFCALLKKLMMPRLTQSRTAASPAPSLPGSRSSNHRERCCSNESEEVFSEGFALLSCLTRLRAFVVQLERITSQCTDGVTNEATSIVTNILSELPSIVSLSLLNPEDLMSTILDVSLYMKPNQLEILKSLLRENDVNFLEKICLRQFKCIRQRRLLSDPFHDIQIIAGEIIFADGKIRAQSHFPSFRLRDVSLSRQTGRWFYECTLLSDGLMQIGYANNLFRCDPVCGQGVGDHFHSWAFDGLRNKKWNVSCETYGKRWKLGDVVGVLMDTDLMEMRFFLNGEDLGPAFTNFHPNHDLFPAISLNVRQSIRFNYGQERFIYPPDEIDGKPYRPVKLANTVKRDTVKPRQIKTADDRRVSNEDAADESKEPLVDAENLHAVDNTGKNNEAELVPSSSFASRMLGGGSGLLSGMSGSMNAQIREREDEESDGVDDSDEEDDDEDEDGVRRGEQWHSDNLRFGSGGEQNAAALTVVGESLSSTNERNGRMLELRREDLIENLIGMGFPIDWALRAAEHSDATASEAAAIAWIIERMEAEQSKMDDGESSSRAGDEEFDENEDSSGMDYLISRTAESAAAGMLLDHRRGPSAYEGNASRLEIGVSNAEASSTSHTSFPNASILNGMIGSPGSAIREEVSSLRQRVNGILQGLALQIESPKSANQSGDGANGKGALSDGMKPIPDRSPTNSDDAVNSARLFSPMIPLKQQTKRRHDKEKQDVLGQISDLHTNELSPIIHCCQVSLTVHYARLIVSKLMILSSQTALLKVIFQSFVTLIPSNLISLLTLLFRQYLPSASSTDHLFFSDNALPSFSPFVSENNMVLLKCLQKLVRRSHQCCSLSFAVDDASIGREAVSQLITFGVTLLNYANLSVSNIHLDSSGSMDELSVSSSIALSMLIEQCLMTLERSVADTADQRNWGLIASVATTSDNDIMRSEAVDQIDDKKLGCVLFAYLTLKNIYESDNFQSCSFSSLLLKLRDRGIEDPIVELASVKTFNRIMKVAMQSSNASISYFAEDLCASILTFVTTQMFRDRTSQDSSEASAALLGYSTEVFLVVSSSREFYHKHDAKFKTESLRRSCYSQSMLSVNRLLGQLHLLGELLEMPKTTVVNSYVTQDWVPAFYKSEDSSPSLRVTQTSSTGITVNWNLKGSRSSVSQSPTTWCLTVAKCGDGIEKAIKVADDLPDIGAYRIDDEPPDTMILVSISKSVKLGSSRALRGPASQDPSQLCQNQFFPDNNLPADLEDIDCPSISLFAATESEPQFVFDPDLMASTLVVGGNQLSLRNTANKKWSTARINSPMESGLHRWEVQIDRCISKNIFIGVCTVDAKFDNYCGCDKYGWAFLANKAIWHNKTKVKSYGELFKTGDIVTVTLDMDAETLSFSLNGLDLGQAVSFENPLIGPLYPAFSLYNEDDQISILPPRQVGDEVAWKTSTIDRILNRTEVLTQLLRFINCQAIGNDKTVRGTKHMTVEELRLRWYRWCDIDDPCTIRSLLIDGELVSVIDSHLDCRSFSSGKLSAGDSVSAELKIGKVLGVGQHKLWICYDNNRDSIVGYSHDDLMQLLLKGTMRLVNRSSSKPSGGSVRHRLTQMAIDGSNAGLHFFQSEAELESVIVQASTVWSRDDDQTLVQFIDALAATHQRHPVHLQLEDIVSGVDGIVSSFRSEITAELRMRLGSDTLETVTKVLKKHNLETVLVRCLLFIHLNDVVESLLPLLFPSSTAPCDRWDSDTASQLLKAKDCLFQTVTDNYWKHISRSCATQLIKANLQNLPMHSPLLRMVPSLQAHTSPSFMNASTLSIASSINVNLRVSETAPLDMLDADKLQSTMKPSNGTDMIDSSGAAPIGAPCTDSGMDERIRGSAANPTTNTMWRMQIEPTQVLLRKALPHSDHNEHQVVCNVMDEYRGLSLSSTWKLGLQIQCSLVGQIYQQLQLIQQTWLMNADIDDRSAPMSRNRWEDILRSSITVLDVETDQNQPPFLLGAASSENFHRIEFTRSTFFQTLKLLPSCQRSLFSLLFEEAIIEVESLLAMVVTDEISLDESSHGVLDILTQFMHMIGTNTTTVSDSFIDVDRSSGLVLGIAIASDISVSLKVPSVLRKILTSPSTASTGQLSTVCGLCLRHGVASVIPDPVLSLWTEDCWNRRLAGWTRTYGRFSPASIQRRARYVDDVSATAPHIVIFWTIVRDLSVRQLTTIINAMSKDNPEDHLDWIIQSPPLDSTSFPTSEIMDVAIVRLEGETRLSVPRYPSIQIMVAKVHAFISAEDALLHHSVHSAR